MVPLANDGTLNAIGISMKLLQNPERTLEWELFSDGHILLPRKLSTAEERIPTVHIQTLSAVMECDIFLFCMSWNWSRIYLIEFICKDLLHQINTLTTRKLKVDYVKEGKRPVNFTPDLVLAQEIIVQSDGLAEM